MNSSTASPEKGEPTTLDASGSAPEPPSQGQDQDQAQAQSGEVNQDPEPDPEPEPEQTHPVEATPLATATPTASAEVAVEAQPASQEIAFDTVVEHGQLASGSEHDTMIGLHLTAPPPAEDDARAPVDCVVVSDVSSSMQGEKISLLKQTVKLLLGDLSKRDRVGLVTFDSNVKEPMRLSENKRLDATYRAEAESLVDKFRAGSATNLSGGLFAGVQQFRAADARPFASIVPPDSPEPAGFGFMSRRGGRQCKSPRPPAPPSAVAAAAPVREVGQSPVAQAGATLDKVAAKEENDKLDQASATVKTCLLLTDGEANHGVRDKDQLVAILKELMQDCPGLSVNTFGYGGNHNSDLLRAVSEAGSGSYYFVESNDDIRSAFGDCLGGVLSIVAQNLVIDIRAAEGTRITKVHHPNAECVTPGAHYTLRLNDLYGEEERDILVSAHLSKREASTEAAPALHCSMQYINVLTGRPTTLACVAAIQRPETVEATDAQPDARIALHRHRITFAETMDIARREAERGDLAAARRRLSTLREETRVAKDKCQHVEAAGALFQGFDDDIAECADGLADEVTFRSKTAHQMSNWASSHMQQRCMESASIDTFGGSKRMRHSAYRTKAKGAKVQSYQPKKR